MQRSLSKGARPKTTPKVQAAPIQFPGTIFLPRQSLGGPYFFWVALIFCPYFLPRLFFEMELLLFQSTPKD